ncbi:hypothetical protein MTO96_004183 [Rhipicephalus appendiculatus]
MSSIQPRILVLSRCVLLSLILSLYGRSRNAVLITGPRELKTKVDCHGTSDRDDGAPLRQASQSAPLRDRAFIKQRHRGLRSRHDPRLLRARALEVLSSRPVRPAGVLCCSSLAVPKLFPSNR